MAFIITKTLPIHFGQHLVLNFIAIRQFNYFC